MLGTTEILFRKRNPCSIATLNFHDIMEQGRRQIQIKPRSFAPAQLQLTNCKVSSELIRDFP